MTVGKAHRLFRMLVGAGLCVCALTPGQSAETTSVPQISGTWGHNNFGYRVPYIDAKGGVIDGHRNEYLKPWTAEAVMRDNFAEQAGRLIPTPHTTCYPDGVPTVFALRELGVLQTPTEVILLFQDAQQARHIYLNQEHSRPVTPSWYGESVGHYEGDTLVVDTIGVSVNPQARVDRYGTPHTEALHIVERFRLLDRPARDNDVIGRPGTNPNAARLSTLAQSNKALELTVSVEDPGAFRKPWTINLNYSPLAIGLEEDICAENNRDWRQLVPTADIPDF
jgi:hypothetical protein